MKTVFGLLLVNVGALFMGANAAHAEADLPLTPAFAEAVGQYRDCVLGGLDRAGFTQPDRMAATAMAACEKAHDAVRTQLATDVSATRPHVSIQAARTVAAQGMARIDPMIAAAALDQARAMIGAASVKDAPSLVRRGTIG